MPNAALQPQPGQVLAKATVRAGQLLGLSGAALARTIGLSEPTVSRIASTRISLLGLRFLSSMSFCAFSDKALGAAPIQLIQKVEGLVATLHYLDGMRAPA